MAVAPQGARWRWLMIATALIGLASCARQAAPEPQPTETIRIDSVRSTSLTSVLVSFNAPVGPSADQPQHYAIASTLGGAVLEVLSATRTADDRAALLATAPQQPINYTLAIERIQGRDSDPTVRTSSTTFDGSTGRAPFVASAIALSPTDVLVSFADPPPGAGAQMSDGVLNPSNYDITEPDPDYAVTPDLVITEIRWADDSTKSNFDRSRVILVTEPQKHTLYQIKATNLIIRSGDKLLDPFLSTVTFNGIPLDDDEAPRVVNVTATSNTTVLVSFSEPVTRAGGDARNYHIESEGGTVLEVHSATLRLFATQVELVTDPMRDELTKYILAVSSAVEDLAGNPMDEQGGTFTFDGMSRHGPIDGDVTPPRVSNVGALSNTEVLVTFSEPVLRAGAEEPEHYRIVGAHAVQLSDVEALMATVPVLEAELLDSRTAVLLKTMPMSDIEYVLSVTNVTDLAGNQIAPPEWGVAYPSAHRFFGIPASGKMVDSDCDGVPDAVELRGWTVRVRTADGSLETREVSSDPGRPGLELGCEDPVNVLAQDTNQDDVSDYEKWLYRLDPRSDDTDGDGLSDYLELNVHYTDPLNQDTDGDGLSDGLEVHFFGTSPLLADTDGDGFSDFDEVMLQNRNPLVADLPLFDIDVVGDVQLGLDVRYVAQSSAGSRTLEQRNSTATLTTSDGTTATRSNQHASEWFVNAGVNLMVGYETGFKFEVGAKVEGGYKESTQTTFTNESVRATQREQASSMQTERELNDNETLNREVVDASMSIALNIVNRGDIAFTISNIELTAKVRDPRDPSRFVHVATLVGQAESVNVGPAPFARGPLRFTATGVTPALIEELRVDPRGIIFEVVNYDVTDEFGRNLAFRSQDVNDRTATLLIDYNGFLPFEPLRVATYSGFNPDGSADGIKMGDAFEKILGLRHVEGRQALRYEQCLTTLDARGIDTCTPEERVEIDTSYSTRVINRREELVRVRSVVANQEQRLAWFVFVPRGMLRSDFRSMELRSGQVFGLVFAQDLDGDGLTSRDEALFGSIDSTLDVLTNACFGTTPFPGDDCGPGDGIPDSRNTDMTGLDDDEQVYGTFRYDVNSEIGISERGNPNAYNPWFIAVQGAEVYRTSANPARADTDGDGLTDCQELGRCDIDVYLFHPDAKPGDPPIAVRWNAEGRLAFAGSTPAGVEVEYDALGRLYSNLVPGLWRGSNGLGLPARFPTSSSTSATAIDPLRTIRLMPGGFGPTITDPRRVDTDEDGLTDFEEIVGFAYRSIDAPGDLPRLVLPPPGKSTDVPAFATNPLSRDTDGDGLTDGTEVRIGTDPRRADGDMARDNDGDGLTNYQEIQGWNVALINTDGELVLCKPKPYAEPYADCRIVEHDLLVARGVLGGSEHLRSVSATGPRRWRFVPGPTDALKPPSYSQALRTLTADDIAEGLGDAFEDIGEEQWYSRNGQSLPNTTSDPNRFDTSGNGLSDYQEWLLGTHPRLLDTDGDGLSDFEEVMGQAYPPDRLNPVRFTDPLNTDTDGDGASDYAELREPWTVRVVGQAPYSVLSDPTHPDADGDGLLDGLERAHGTDPNLWDTDGDGVSDNVEVNSGIGGVMSNPLLADQLVGFRFTNATVLGGCPLPDGEHPFYGWISWISYHQYFEGQLKVELPDGTVKTLANLSQATGASQGTTVPLTNTPLTQHLALGEGETFRVFSGPVAAGVELTVTDPQWFGVTIEPSAGGGIARSSGGPYDVGDSVTFTATPDAGYEHTAWGGACNHVQASQPCRLTLTGPVSVSATFTDTTLPQPITITASPSAGGSITADPAGPYHAGDTVDFDAEPEAGYLHASWGGACSHVMPGETCELTLNADATISAIFAEEPEPDQTVTVTIDHDIANGGVTADPLSDDDYAAGDTVTFTATPDTGYLHTAWAGACDHVEPSQPCHLVLTADATVSATFSAIVPVTIAPSENGAVDADAISPYHEGQAVTFTATPSTGYVHDAWGGDCSNVLAGEPCELTLGDDNTVSASFERAPITVTHATFGSGTITAIPADGYKTGDEVTFTATADPGYHHSAWGHGCSDATAGQPCVITLATDTTVSAAFKETRSFRVETNDLGSFTQSYDYPTPGGLHYIKLSGPYEDPEQNTKSCELGISWRIERLR
jgi:hypothetical protein